MIEAMPKPASPTSSTPRARGMRAMPRAATMPTARITHRSAGYHVGLHPRMTKAQAMLATMAAARASRGKSSVRRAPQGRRTHAHQRPDGRGQGDGVIGVDDAVGEAEDGPGEQQPAPEERKPARTRSVLGARRVSHKAATRPIRAPGINQEICPPIEERNSRSHPVGPHMLPGGAAAHRRCRSRCR